MDCGGRICFAVYSLRQGNGCAAIVVAIAYVACRDQMAPGGETRCREAALPPLSVPVPSVDAPSRNVTVPVAEEGETLAAKATDWPTVDGLRLDVTVVVVFVLATAFTVWTRMPDALPPLLLSPL